MKMKMKNKTKTKKLDLYIAVAVLVFLLVGSFVLTYKVGQTKGENIKHGELIACRMVRTGLQQEIDSLKLEIEKAERFKQFPEEKQRQILSDKWTREELPKFQQSCREWKQKNPNKPVMWDSPCSMGKMLREERINIEKGLR